MPTDEIVYPIWRHTYPKIIYSGLRKFDRTDKINDIYDNATFKT